MVERVLPRVSFGPPEETHARSPAAREPDDDGLLAASPPDVVALLGFDPTEARIDKTEAEYQDSPRGGARCERCTMFEAPDACTLVEGEVEARGWCRYFERQDED